METPSSPASSKPFHLLIKPMGPVCNLACEYCFYLDKVELYPHRRSFRMSVETLENLTRQYIEAQPAGTGEVNFAWQGGEPTLLGVDFFRKAVALQARYRRGDMAISNSLQTNGILLDDEWGEFLQEHHFLIGLSIDGPEDLHDRYRHDRRGKGTFRKVMAGLEVLQKHDVEFNILTVVQAHNGDHAGRVYDFLKSIGARFFQLIPLVEWTGDGGVSPRTVGPEQYGRFMNGILDRWLDAEDVGTVFVQDFDMLLGLVLGRGSSVCTHSETCGRALAVEHNGDLYSCDHYVYPSNLLGNLADTAVASLVDGPQQQQFGRDKRDRLPDTCRACDYLRYCAGGCPKDRRPPTDRTAPGLNVLCPGYRSFYRHSLPVFHRMAKCLRLGRPAAEYRDIESAVRRMVDARGSSVGRNDPCPCGSGLKYKQCCLPAT